LCCAAPTDPGGAGRPVPEEQYGRLLAGFRAARGLSGYAVARAAGLHPNLLARSEAGRRTPDDPAEIEALARALTLGRADLDRLLLAAGFWPAALIALGPDDPTLRALATALTCPEVGADALEQFRAGVEALAGALVRAAGTGTTSPIPPAGQTA
jgi:transcriptional regulator with XRE-family HTH domain